MQVTRASNWQANSSIETLHFRAQLFTNIRSFFQQKQVLEVETPILSQAASCDVFIDSFSTSQYEKKYFLQTSPEFAMKRLLASGSGDIFQIAKAFRQEESGCRHNPEFTLLEWYRIGFDEQQLMAEVEALILHLISCQTINTQVNKKIDIEHLSYRDCFIQNLSINPHTATIFELKQCAQKYDLDNTLSDKDDKDRWLELLLSCVLEKGLAEKDLGGTIEQPKMTFLFDYPASQASLARIGKNTYGEQVAKRFELYFAAMEVANGFYELDNAKEQLDRFLEDNVQRKKLAKPQMPIDQHLIDALTHGLPSCAGVALGIDRLIMVLQAKSHINDILSFPFDRA